MIMFFLIVCAISLSICFTGTGAIRDNQVTPVLVKIPYGISVLLVGAKPIVRICRRMLCTKRLLSIELLPAM